MASRKIRRYTATAIIGLCAASGGIISAAPASASYVQYCAHSYGGVRVWEYSNYSGNCVDISDPSSYNGTYDSIYYSDGQQLFARAGSVENDAVDPAIYCEWSNYAAPCVHIYPGTSNNPLDFNGIGSIAVNGG